VEVEYDLFWNNRKYKEQPFPDEYAIEKDRVYKLKLNSNNEISIKLIKDSWNREEVQKLLIDLSAECLCEDGLINGPAEVLNWIKENL